jgi:hypothetical protein
MRIAGFYLVLALPALIGIKSGSAAPVTGSFSATLTPTDIASFSGDILGTPAGDFHVGDAVTGTFTYDPALMPNTSGFPSIQQYTGAIDFSFDIGAHHLSYGSTAGNVTLFSLSADPAFNLYSAQAIQFVGDYVTALALVATSFTPVLYSDPHDLNSVHFQNFPSRLAFAFRYADPYSSESIKLGDFEIQVLGSVPVATTPIPAGLPLLATAVGGLGFLGYRRRRVVAA